MIGPLVIDLATHEVYAGDAARQRLTPKAIGVLKVLIEHEGTPVHRDQLIEKVWPRQFPTDDVVTKAVRELRRALGETDDHPVIATLPKVGYLLKLPVVALPEIRDPAQQGVATAAIEEAPASEVDPAAGTLASEMVVTSAQSTAAESAPLGRPARRGRPVAAMLMGAATLVVAAGWYLWSRGEPATPAVSGNALSAPANGTPASLAPRLDVQPFTADPGDEGAPDVSADGKLVAYSSRRRDSNNYRIFIRSADGLSERRLTTSAADEEELQPVFAPDGHQLAYQVIDAEQRCSLRLVDLNGGSPRHLADCASGFLVPIEFSHDGRFLLLPRVGRFRENAMGLQQLDLDSGALSDYAYPSPQYEPDVEARFSPDGRQLVLRRGAAPNSQLLLHAVGSAEPPRLVPGVTGLIRGMTWLHDNRNVVFATDASGVMELWRLDTRDGLVERFGGIAGYFPAAASRAGLLVTQQVLRPSALLTATLDGKPDSQRASLFGSTRSESWPAFSPDGTQLAFVSDRTGSSQIYLGRLPGGEVSQLSQFPAGRPLALHFAPDGRQIAFSLRTMAGPQVGVLEIGSRRIRLLELPGLSDPGRLSFAPDGSLLLDAMDAGMQRRIFRLAHAGDVQPVAIGDCTGRMARQVASGRIYFLGPESSGLYVQEAGASTCRLLSEAIRWATMDSWTVRDSGPVAALMSGDSAGLFQLDPQTGAATLIESLDLEWTSATGLAISPDGQTAVVTAPIDEQGDLVMVRGF